jgi:1-phosphofructokinase family hexose kinase
VIVCAGTTPVWQRSMVFERLRLHEVNRAASVHDYASGKAVNVARVLHTLGEDVVVSGFAGGARGDAMLRDLESAGIRHEFAAVDAPTRQCITVIDRERSTATELVEESLPVSAGAWPLLDRVLDQLLRDARGVVLSGSLPPGAPQEFYLSCLRRVIRPGVSVVVDARAEPLRHALRHAGFVAKLNREELAATAGRSLDGDDAIADAARQLAPVGGAMVVTLGAEGAIAVDQRNAWRVRVPRIAARSAVGSGDAFSAGLVLGLIRGESLPEACARGAACGAANAMTDLAGHLSTADVEAIRKQVRVERA